eukprot:GHVR01051020.1.p1 GENE.GHVR01051020.1~~GHVR01051020.1.p1  ORF type:complete len:1043 (+),score=157.92 GHVR01051020.1:522-3650(+)
MSSKFSSKEASCFFSYLTEGDAFSVWKRECDLRMTGRPDFVKMGPAIPAFVAAELFTATKYHPKASVAVAEIFDAKDAGAYKEVQTDTVDWKTVEVALWNAIKSAVDLKGQDAEEFVRKKFRLLAERKGTYAGSLQALLTDYKSAVSSNAHYKTEISSAEMAKYLTAALPKDITTPMRFFLGRDYLNPDKIVEAIESTVLNSGDGAYAENSALAIEDGVAAHAGIHVTGKNNFKNYNSNKQNNKYHHQGNRRNQGERNRNNNGCKFCGRGPHEQGFRCPALDNNCLNCGKKGHYTRVCWSKPTGEASTGTARNVTTITQPQQICEGGAWLCTSVDSQLGTVCRVEKAECKKLYIDSGCTTTVLPRAYVEAYIVRERSCDSTLGMAVAGSTFKVESEGILQLPLVNATSGKPMVVLHRALLSKDSRVQPLLRGQGVCLDAGGSTKKSYVDIVDFYGKLRRAKVDYPLGDATHNLPYLLLGLPVLKNELKAMTTITNRTIKDISELRQWHHRMLHCGPLRLSGTLRSAGYHVEPKMLKQLTDTCEMCQRKNAVRVTPHPVPNRRAGVASFGDVVYWDLMHVSETGHGGVQVVSVLVDLKTKLWDLKELPKGKGQAPDHLLEFMAERNIVPKQLRSDNAPELRKGRTAAIAQERGIYIAEGPPHCPEQHGVAERAIRDIRAMLAVALEQLELPSVVWPLIIKGIENTHNKVSDTELDMSPWEAVHGIPPTLTLMFGDKVVFKPPASATAPKELKVSGVVGIYVSALNSSTCRVLVKGATGKYTVYLLHPAWVAPLRRGVEAEELRSSARSFVPNEVKKIGEGLLGSDSEDVEPEHFSLIPTVPIVSEVDKAKVQAGVLIPDKGQIRPAVIVGTPGKRSLNIAWLEETPDGSWITKELGKSPVSKSQVQLYFDIVQGRLPENAIQTMGSKAYSNLTGTTKEETTVAMAVHFKGGSTHYPATIEENINAGIYEKAKLGEYVSILKNGVLGEKVDRRGVSSVMPLGWRLTMKEDSETGSRKPKARLYSQGFRDRRNICRNPHVIINCV